MRDVRTRGPAQFLPLYGAEPFPDTFGFEDDDGPGRRTYRGTSRAGVGSGGGVFLGTPRRSRFRRRGGYPGGIVESETGRASGYFSSPRQRRTGDFLLGTATFLPRTLRNTALGAGFTTRFGGGLGLVGLGAGAGIGGSYLIGREFAEENAQAATAVRELIREFDDLGDAIVGGFGPAITLAIEGLGDFANFVNAVISGEYSRNFSDRGGILGILGLVPPGSRASNLAGGFYSDVSGFLPDRGEQAQILNDYIQSQVGGRQPLVPDVLLGSLPNAAARAVAARGGYGFSQTEDPLAAGYVSPVASNLAEIRRQAQINAYNRAILDDPAGLGVPGPGSTFPFPLRDRLESRARITAAQQVVGAPGVTGGFGALSVLSGIQDSTLQALIAGIPFQQSLYESREQLRFESRQDDITTQRLVLEERLNDVIYRETQLRLSLTQHLAREALDIPSEQLRVNEAIAGLSRFAGVTPSTSGSQAQRDALRQVLGVAGGFAGLEGQSLEALNRASGGNLRGYISDFVSRTTGFQLSGENLDLIVQQIGSAQAVETSEDLSFQRRSEQLRAENNILIRDLNEVMRDLITLLDTDRVSPLFERGLSLPGGP